MFGDLVVNLIARVNQFTQPLGRARQSLSVFKTDVGKSVGGVLSHFQGLSGIGAIVSGAVGGLTLGAALTWGTSMAIEAEKAQIAFATMLKSPEKAKLLLADLSTFAASTPYESPEITKAAKSLLAYGTSAQSIVPTLRMLGDVASGVGMPLDELAYLFGTAQVQGKLFAKDINQFTGRGIPIIQALADVMKVTKGEVMDLASKGAITSDIMTQAFQNMTANGGQFSGMMAAQSATTSGLFSTLKDNVGLALRDISAALMEGFNLKGLFADGISFTDTFRANIEAWLPIFVSIGTTTREWFNWMINTAASLYKTLAFVFGNFGELASLTLSQVGLYFVTLGNDIAHFFTGTLPAAMMGFVSYASQILGTLLDNISGKMADLKSMVQGGVATHQWKPLGDVQFEMNAPRRNETPFEKSLKESIENRKTRLGESVIAGEMKPTAPKVPEAATRVPDYVPGGSDQIAAKKKEDEKKVGEAKQPKLGGALGVRTQEAYRAIVSAMTGQRSDPQAEQLRALKKIAQNGERERDDIRKIREKLVDQGDQVLERI